MKTNYIISTFFCVFVLSFSTMSIAATLTVDQSGSSEYLTIQSAINDTVAGDVVKILPGLYEESVVLDKSIKLTGSGPNFTTISPPSVGDSRNGITISAPNIVIENITITNAAFGIYMIGSTASYVIQRCVISGCEDTGIHFEKTSSYLLLQNNTIFSNAGHGIYILSSGDPRIRSNIIVKNKIFGITFNNSANTARAFSNNCLYRNQSNNYNNCVAGDDDIEADPKFVNEETSNLILASDSPCINNGVIGLIYNDPDGSRNDIGAYAGQGASSFWPYYSNGPIVTDLNIIPSSIPKGGKISIKATGHVQNNK
jgi:parallel beta-helix repeat protein